MEHWIICGGHVRLASDYGPLDLPRSNYLEDWIVVEARDAKEAIVGGRELSPAEVQELWELDHDDSRLMGRKRDDDD